MNYTIKTTYVPINTKMDSMMHILSSCLDNTTGTYPVGKVTVFELVEIARLYTNIELPEDVVEAYDMLAAENFDLTLKTCDAVVDINRFRTMLAKQIEKLESYQTSAYGILDSIKNDYGNFETEVKSVLDQLSNAENFETVKAVVEKLG